MGYTTLKRWVISGIAGLMITAVSNAFVLDWESVDWAGGATNQTFYNVDGSGMDVSISLAITGAAWAQWNGQNQPDDNRRLGGDGGTPYGNQGEGFDSSGNPSDEALHLHIDSVARDFTGYVEVVIRFSRAVTGVGFDLFDVDNGGGASNTRTFEDVIGNIGGSLNNVAVAPATVTYDSSGIQYNPNRGGIYRGSYYSPDAENSVLGLAWNTQVVDTVTFRYYAGDRTNTTPGTQGISISDINFASAVPEPGTVAGGLVLLVGLTVGEFHRRRRANGLPVS